MLKKIISLLFVFFVITGSLFAFAEDNNSTVEQSEEEIIDKNQEKLDNIKKSNIDKMVDYEPNKSGEDKELDKGIDSLSDTLRYVFEEAKELWNEFSLMIVVVVSAFSFVMFFVFKMLKVKSAQKTAITMTIVPFIFYAIYNIVPAFLSTM